MIIFVDWEFEILKIKLVSKSIKWVKKGWKITPDISCNNILEESFWY